MDDPADSAACIGKARIEYPCSVDGWTVRREFLRLRDPLPRARFREATKLGDGLQSVAGRLLKKVGGNSDSLLSIRIAREWQAIVGDAIAAHATPAALQNGTLQIRVNSHTWLAELRREQRHLLANINRALAENGKPSACAPVRLLRFCIDFSSPKTPPV